MRYSPEGPLPPSNAFIVLAVLWVHSFLQNSQGTKGRAGRSIWMMLSTSKTPIKPYYISSFTPFIRMWDLFVKDICQQRNLQHSYLDLASRDRAHCLYTMKILKDGEEVHLSSLVCSSGCSSLTGFNTFRKKRPHMQLTQLSLKILSQAVHLQNQTWNFIQKNI